MPIQCKIKQYIALKIETIKPVAHWYMFDILNLSLYFSGLEPQQTMSGKKNQNVFQLYTYIYFLYWCCLYIRHLLSDWMFLMGIDNICKIKYPVTARPRTYETRQPLDTKDAVHRCCCRAALVTLMVFPWVLIIQILWHVVGQANGAGSRSRLQIMITWVVTRPGTETVCVFTLENEAEMCSVTWKMSIL